MNRTIKVLIAKPGLDGHDRGALVIAQALRDAGMQVTYSGIRKTPLDIVRLARHYEVDCVGLSCLSGAHNTLFPEVARLLRHHGSEHVLLIGGGIIPDTDIPFLLSQGFAKIFTQGTRTEDVIRFISENVSDNEKEHRDRCFKTASV